MELDLGDRMNLNILNFLPPDAKLLLEIGCGIGTLGKEYQQINPDCQYMGMESDRSQAEIAAQKLDRVFTSNCWEINETDSNLLMGRVDCLIYGHILPYLSDPWGLLKQHIALLKDNGQVLARIPNVQHWGRLLNLIQGKWEDQEQDWSSGQILRYFTLDTINQMFTEAGLQVFDIQNQESNSEDFQKLQSLLVPVLNFFQINPKTFAEQCKPSDYLVRAFKSPTPPRRLLIQTLIRSPTGRDRVRVFDPDRFSSTIPGVRTIASMQPVNLNAALPQEEKVFIWQAAILEYPKDIPGLKRLLEYGYLIVAEFDDDPLHRSEYAENQFLSFRGSHCVQTTTKPLANYLRELNPNVAIFANQLAYLPPVRTYSNDNSVTLFFGALLREKDWPEIMPALNRILADYPNQVRVKVIHDRLFFDALQTEQKEFEPFCPYEKYEAIMRSCDIGILPLAPNRYNSMKSDLKFIQCAGHGVAALASPTVYENSIIEGETGLIYRSAADFEVKLRTLIENCSLRHQLTANAYEYVRHNRLLSQHYRERREWYLQMRDDLPRLNEELYSRFPELFKN